MNQVIRDRRPTKADADKFGEIEFWDEVTETWQRGKQRDIALTTLHWRPIDQTPPQEPEKPKRKKRIHHNNAGEVCDVWLEVLPGDPKDLDALLDEIDTPVPNSADESESLLDGYREWTKRICAARHGEGGE